MSLPLPTAYVVDRDAYTLTISTPVGASASIQLEAKGHDERPLSVKGRSIHRATTAPAGRYFVDERPYSRLPLHGALEFSVHDESGAELGSERFSYRTGEYGAVWDTDCI